MNLSSYLQMPPAPAVPQSLSTSATQGLAAGVRADAGANAGQDFANIMARQFQRLSASERPSFAAETPPRPEVSAQADQAQRAQWATNTSYATQQRLNDDRQQATSRNARTDKDLAQSQDRAARADDASKNEANKSDAETTATEKSTDEKRAEQRAQQLRDAASAKALNAADATLLAQVAMMAMPPASSTQGTATAAPEAGLSLRTIALSPQVHIITTPSATPNAESLTAFAKSMGLDEAAIQKLLGEGATHPASSATLAGQANPAADAALATANGVAAPAGLATFMPASANATDPLAQALNDAVAGMSASSANPMTDAAAATPAALTSTSSAATQLAALGLLPDAASTKGVATPTDGAINAQATPFMANANTPVTAPQTPVGLSAAEMASIQEIQITITAPAAAPVASLQTMAMPATAAGASLKTSSSTLDALSLLGGNVTEQSISDLVAQFSHNAADGDDAQQQPYSGNSSGQGFAQALAQISAPTPTTNANAASQVATTTPMSEVYDQLSDKMATEMAARMHKQLSDGEWKMKFGLRPAHLGGVEIQLEMKDGKLNAVFQAENPLTRDLLQNSSQRLREALENFGIHAGQMHIGQDSGNAQQNPSRGSSKPSQVGDNSSLQVKGSDNVANTTETRNKANASLLDLYA
jgi:flagellar hook-length control protein FliK